jgi:DNA-binding MarR family transcriptional regulator
MEVLLDLKNMRFLAPFLRGEYSAAEVATLLGLEYQLVYRKIKRFERSGLVKKCHTVTRRGASIVMYKAVAERFFMPSKLLPIEEALERCDHSITPKMRQALTATLLTENNHDLGTLFYLGENENFILELGFEDASKTLDYSAPMVKEWRSFSLSQETALAFQNDLLQLLERYRAPSGKSSYLVHMEFAPWNTA